MAVVDMFLKLAGVDGESQDTEHKNEIQIQGFKMNVRSPRDATTGKQTGKIRCTDMTVFAGIEKSTAKLFQMITTNQNIPKAELACRKAGKNPFEFFKITLEDCYLSRVEIGTGGGEGGNVVPPCEFDIEFGKIKIESREQTATGPTTGPVVAAFDLRTNK